MDVAGAVWTAPVLVERENVQADVLIVGGGLAGLALAEALHRAGVNFILTEARGRLGGRIKTEHVETAAFDMGPAWFWPGQPRMAALVERFSLKRFDQFAKGTLSFEDEQGQVQRGRGYASMEGSFRLDGGLSELTMALAQCLPTDALRLGDAVQSLEYDEQNITATTAQGCHISARHVVLAIPPRIATELSFTPDLPQNAVKAMEEVSTWMAGQAKAVAVYDQPFWRQSGLSGDAMSRHGPMVEIHDASPANGGLGALFGFIGVPPSSRVDAATLRSACVAQLVRLFGPEAGNPKQVFLKDWAADPLTATPLDSAPMYAHPTYGGLPSMQGLWGGQLHLGGTEVAPTFGGYLEGALEAAELAFEAVMLVQVKA